jgi:hypothetical protein
METFLGQSPNVYNPDLGEFVREDHMHLAQVLKDLKPTYNLVYIPVKDRTTPEEKQKPWAILDWPDNLPEYVVRYLSEEEMKQPHKVLAWLFDGDVVRHGAENVLKRIEAEENAKKLLDFKRQEEELEDRIDYADFLFTGGRDKKHTISHNGKKFER